jgi:hypothetical protein
MVELRTIEGDLTTSDLANCGIPPKDSDGPKLVEVREPETLDRAVASSEPMSFAETVLAIFDRRSFYSSGGW